MSESAPNAEKPRVTTDTNQFISALIRRGAPYRMVEAWLRGEFVLVLSHRLASEISDVARRPYISERYGLSEARIRLTEEQIARHAELLPALDPLPPDLVVRDPKDEHVLQTALTGNADYLVTGDDDLLSLSDHDSLGSLHILTVNDFLEQLRTPRH